MVEIDFGKKIKRLIEGSGDTYAQAAERIGSTPSTVNRWTRQKDVDTSALKLLCAGYNVPISYFLNDSESYNQSVGTINGINAVGKKIMQSGSTSFNTDSGSIEVKILQERLKNWEDKLKSCEEKNVLLERMVAILEKK